MGDPKAFLKIHRQEAGYRPVHERITDFGEVEQTLNTNDRRLQASRCMDCGIPFCHWACPVSNKQPEWQELFTEETGKKHTKYSHPHVIFPSLRVEFVRRLARRVVYLNYLLMNL